ncbi:GspH/FimT family protein [Thalassotalea psychrophila]|uniref:Type II secretion system protein H n=1 Tax=Thalassotalea psychrophila TaxID=3065647 RepID=A0ABY9TYC3_9GAMM|nr:GspH/FimT family protein [Colwelliaceae bacterium SQ149]
MKKISGLTLIEILITILILSILAGVAGPSFLDSFDKRKLISATEQLYSSLQQARSESLSRSKTIYWKATTLRSKNWAFGMSEDAFCNPLITVNTDANACVLTVDDGDGDYNAEDDAVMHRISGLDFDEISIKRSYSGSTTDEIKFDPTRGTTDVGGYRYYTLTSELGKDVQIRLSIIGTIKICSDDISDYEGCS